MTEDTENIREVKPRKVDTPLPEGAPEVPFDPDYYALDDCGLSRRGGDTEYPYTGAGVWLSPYEAGVGMIEGATGFTSSNADRVAGAFPALRAGLADSVVYIDAINPVTGTTYPQVWKNPDGALAWPSTLLFYVWSLVVNGEPPDARPKESRRGSRGTRTRSTTAARS